MKESFSMCDDDPSVGAQFPACATVAGSACNQKSYDSRKSYIRSNEILIVVDMLVAGIMITCTVTNRLGHSTRRTVAGGWFRGSTSRGTVCNVSPVGLGHP